MVDSIDQRFLNQNVDQRQFISPLKQQRIPKWFTDIPKNAKKWICTLHSDIDFIGQNLDRPHSPLSLCCPHAMQTLHQNEQFIVIWHNDHEILKPFEQEIAELIGTVQDPNGYLFARNNIKDPTLIVVNKLKNNQILQPLQLALQQAHKQGFVGSFKRYDEIILQLAKQAGDLLTEQHNKVFDRYEKCRNLALGTSEMGERHNAAIHAYEQGRKLIDQLTEAMKPTPQQSQQSCELCGSGLKLKINKSTGEIICRDCLINIRNAPFTTGGDIKWPT